jgi:methylated-DNA-[protein]-cysteine S-methyltransferase
MKTLTLGWVTSPIGRVAVAESEDGLVAVEFEERFADRTRRLEVRYGGVAFVSVDDSPNMDRLRRYFTGELTALEGARLDPGGTELQRGVWRELTRIPCGVTRSYGELARAVGRPKASRAIGAANGQNPVALFAPCHRVIGATGDLTGYAGGLSRKRWLLRHEGALPQERSSTSFGADEPALL